MKTSKKPNLETVIRFLNFWDPMDMVEDLVSNNLVNLGGFGESFLNNEDSSPFEKRPYPESLRKTKRPFPDSSLAARARRALLNEGLPGKPYVA